MQTSACRSDDETNRPSDELHSPRLTYRHCGLVGSGPSYAWHGPKERTLMDMIIDDYAGDIPGQTELKGEG
jgi:hypothetical protein